MPSLFKSEIGRQEVLKLYDEKLNALNIDYHYKLVDTSFGTTNVIITGDPANPPLFIIHGSNGCAPIGLESYPNLSSHFQVFAIDVIGQPNKSAGTQMNMKDNSYGKWVNEIIDALNVKNVTLVGFSLGGLVILKTLVYKGERIKEAFLAAPAFIVNGNPLKALFKIFIPMKRYMMSQKVGFLEKFLNELFTDKDDFALKFLSKVFLHFKMDFSPVPTIRKSEASEIATPITLFAAKRDLLFPGEKMLKRAAKIFTSLKTTVLLEESNHVQSKADNLKIEKMIIESKTV